MDYSDTEVESDTNARMGAGANLSAHAPHPSALPLPHFNATPHMLETDMGIFESNSNSHCNMCVTRAPRFPIGDNRMHPYARTKGGGNHKRKRGDGATAGQAY